jgi:general secretion pathway protein K
LKKRNRFADTRGVALIMVLWVITVLSVIALEFSYAMRTEVKITRNYQDDLRLYAMAQGGVERAVAELVYKQDPKVQEYRKRLSAEEGSAEKREWVTDGREYPLAYEKGACRVRVTGEAGKLNINLVSETTLRKIISNLGLEGEPRDVVVDSILDWLDPDDLHRMNGAENDYYQNLPEPYNCKNGNLDSIEELLLIRGVTPELFYGKKGAPSVEEDAPEPVGLKDIFTIYSNEQKIDINSATLTVLRVILGVSPPTARMLIKAREEKAFESQDDLLRRVPELAALYGDIGPLILFRGTTPYYTIESKAADESAGEATRALKVIVKIDGKEKGGHKIIQWVDFVL